jgi:hypothetical protein
MATRQDDLRSRRKRRISIVPTKTDWEIYKEWMQALGSVVDLGFSDKTPAQIIGFTDHLFDMEVHGAMDDWSAGKYEVAIARLINHAKVRNAKLKPGCNIQIMGLIALKCYQFASILKANKQPKNAANYEQLTVQFLLQAERTQQLVNMGSGTPYIETFLTLTKAWLLYARILQLEDKINGIKLPELVLLTGDFTSKMTFFIPIALVGYYQYGKDNLLIELDRTIDQLVISLKVNYLNIAWETFYDLLLFISHLEGLSPPLAIRLIKVVFAAKALIYDFDYNEGEENYQSEEGKELFAYFKLLEAKLTILALL